MPSISHSRMELWAKCPYAYRLTHVDKVPRPPSPALVFGRAIHAAIEQDTERRSRGVRHSPAQAQIQAIADFHRAFTADLNESDPTGLLRGDEAWLRHAQRRALAILTVYAEQVAPDLYPAPSSVEESFSIPLSFGFTEAGTWSFVGRIDARTAPPAHLGRAPAIIDFKTGKRWAVGAEHEKAQATAYLWAEQQRGAVLRGEEEPARRVTFICLPDETLHQATLADALGNEEDAAAADVATLPSTHGASERITVSRDYRTTTRTDAQVAAYQDRVERTIDAMMDAARTGDYPANPGPLCGWCDVLGHCQVGQAWLRARHRPSHVPGVDLDAMTTTIAATARPGD